MRDVSSASAVGDPSLLERLRARMQRTRDDDKPQHVAIVGNGPLAPGSASEIDAADVVVRFNHPRGFPGPAGQKLTHLFLINCGGQMEEWLSDPAFGSGPPFDRAELVVLAIDPQASGTLGPSATRDERNWTPEAAARLGARGNAVALLPACDFHGAKRALLARSERRAVAPSTGVLAIQHFVRTRRPDDPPIQLRAFGFAGWDGHDWVAERRLCDTWAGRGWVSID